MTLWDIMGQSTHLRVESLQIECVRSLRDHSTTHYHWINIELVKSKRIKLKKKLSASCVLILVIQPRSCIALGGNTSSQSLLKSCSVIVHRVGESDGNL